MLEREYSNFRETFQLEGNFPTKIAHSGDEIQFGASNRSYKITIDYTKMQRAAE